jgi:hypothetical protein
MPHLLVVSMGFYREIWLLQPELQQTLARLAMLVGLS